MARKGEIVFLVRIRERFSYLSDEQFLNAFSCAIYDFLDDKGVNYKDGFERYYGKELASKLIKVSEEFMLVDRHLNGHFTKEFMKECLNGKYSGFIRYRLKPYFTPLLNDKLNEEESQSLYIQNEK